MGFPKILSDGVTLKERKFIKEYVKHGVGTKAMKVAHPNLKYPDKKSNELLKRPRVKKRIEEVLRDNGLDLNFTARMLKEQIQSGVGVDANAASANAALGHLLKLQTQNVEKQGGGSVHLHFTQDIGKLSNTDLVKKRNNVSEFFSKIVEGEETTNDDVPADEKDNP